MPPAPRRSRSTGLRTRRCGPGYRQLAKVSLEEGVELLLTSLLGGEALEGRPLRTPERAEEEWDRTGRRCELCGGRTHGPFAPKAVCYQVSHRLVPKQRIRMGISPPAFVVCEPCWRFLSSIPSWRVLSHRISRLQELIAEGLAAKKAKIPMNVTMGRSDLRMRGQMVIANTGRHAAEAPPDAPRMSSEGRWTPEEDGDAGEDEL